MSGDISQIQVGRQPSGIRPIAPVTPVAPAHTPTAPLIIVPAGGRPRRGRIILIGLLAVVIIGIAIAVFTSYFGKSSTTSPTPSANPSTTATATSTPQGKTLQSYFGKPSGTDTTTVPEAGLFRGVDLPVAYNQPSDLASAVGLDQTWLIFGQNELYGSTGQQLSAATVEARSVAIRELTDVTSARQAVQTWEAGTMSSDLAGFLGYDTAHSSTTAFSDGTYRQFSIRYRNFPYPDHSIDWSIVTGSNGTTYLVIAGSRQGMFAAIDILTQ